jgi:hypothetical protein
MTGTPSKETTTRCAGAGCCFFPGFPTLSNPDHWATDVDVRSVPIVELATSSAKPFGEFKNCLRSSRRFLSC